MPGGRGLLLLASMLATMGAAPPPPTAHFAWVDYRGSDPADATHRPGPADYRNPIVQGFYSDPSVERVGNTYYLVTSTFSFFPGIPVFRSTDLVHWTQIGNVIDRPGQLNFTGRKISEGVFAATIRRHDGRFYVINTCVNCGGNFIVTATNPAGPWSDPIWLKGIDGIDPSMFFDDDGRVWIVNNGNPVETPRYDGHRAIWIQEFDPRAQKMIGPRKVLLDAGVDPSTNPAWIEGPHLYKHDGHYYLMAAEGGTSVKHSEVILRADAVTGPYVPWTGNPILTQRDLPADRRFPVTSTGHADLIETQTGDWWAVFLGTRPYAGDLYNTGRETFLLPVHWTDGWPVILPHAQAVPLVVPSPKLPPATAPHPTSGPFQIRTTFVGATLPPEWMMMRNPATRWYRTGGGLTLQARPQRLGDMANPSFVGHRQQHSDAHVDTALTFTPTRDGDKAGLAAVQNDDFYYFVGLVRDHGTTELHVERRAGAGDDKDGVVIAHIPFTGKAGAPLYLGIDAAGAHYSFRYATAPGQWRTLLKDADGTILSTNKAGGFVGTLIGPYATSR